MNQKYLILNAGSSSLKFSLYDVASNKEIVNGNIERIGEEKSVYSLKFQGKKIENSSQIKNHIEAVNLMFNELLNNNFINDLNEIVAAGHRVLHGGEIYKDSVVIDDKVIDDIKALTKFGPLHHPSEIAVIEEMRKILPNIANVAVFDTAFHQTMPKENYIYPVPNEWYEENGVRKFGFHGTSYKYVTNKMKQVLNKEDVNLIICHIGSGASICCVENGKSIDTTMGLTPLDGLMMCTRSGAIDPAILEYISKERNIPISDVITILNKKSGLLGMCSVSDYRDIVDLASNGDANAILALDMHSTRAANYIAEYYLKLKGKVDAIVFTAGVGENAKEFRELVVKKLEPLGVTLNENMNNSIAKFLSIQEGIITNNDSKIPIHVIHTDEEAMILEDIKKLTMWGKKCIK